MVEPYSDSSSSELSDIPEVEEELIGSQESLLNEVGLGQTNQKASPSQVITEIENTQKKKNPI